jgi:SNF2 family DNA or RNA helicase
VHVIANGKAPLLPTKDTAVVIISYDLVAKFAPQMRGGDSAASLAAAGAAATKKKAGKGTKAAKAAAAAAAAAAASSSSSSDDDKRVHFPTVVCDESHFLKTSSAKRTKATLPILAAARRRLLLTGTPALSRPAELYTQAVSNAC